MRSNTETNSVLADEAVTKRPSASRQLEDAIIGEIADDGIQGAAIESFQESLQQFTSHLLGHL